MANSLSVNITADIADLHAKMALAQADVRAFGGGAPSDAGAIYARTKYLWMTAKNGCRVARVWPGGALL